jgi:hypothetical protein
MGIYAGGLAVEFSTFLVTVFCLVDDWLKDPRIRQRGRSPRLSDSDVLTMEIVGEFKNIDTDEGIYEFFLEHYKRWFPQLERTCRTTLVRQAANLWDVKQRLWKHLVSQLPADPMITIMDRFPMPVCRFARAKRCRRLREHSAYGHDAIAKQTFYGLRVHLIIAWPGIIVDFRRAPANVSDVEGAQDMLSCRHGWTLGDRNYWSPTLQAECQEHGLSLLAPYKSAKREKTPFPSDLTQMRRRIETVIGQLVERYHAKKVWARDAWHLWSRWLRKVVSHTVAVWCCLQQGLSPLKFDELLNP